MIIIILVYVLKNTYKLIGIGPSYETTMKLESSPYIVTRKRICRMRIFSMDVKSGDRFAFVRPSSGSSSRLIACPGCTLAIDGGILQ